MSCAPAQACLGSSCSTRSASRCASDRRATTISIEKRTRPGARFLLRHPAHFIAFGGGVGLAPFAPGTFGTLLAFPIFWAIGPWLEPAAYLGAMVFSFAIGVWACDVTGRDLGSPDDGAMVWDETTAFLVVLFFTPGGYWQVVAFVLFRFFDVVKPPPIRYYERVFKGGWGVMIDDIVAAFFTLFVLAVARTIFE